jgi:hypothetical protein
MASSGTALALAYENKKIMNSEPKRIRDNLLMGYYKNTWPTFA